MSGRAGDDGLVDFHTHAPAWQADSWLSGGGFTVEQFCGFMDVAGIATAVVLSYDGLFEPGDEANRRVGQFVGARPDRLVGFGTVNPRRPDAAEQMRRCFTEYGLRGLKLHPWLQGVSMHEAALDPVAEVAAVYGGVVLCHDGTPPYSTASQIAAFARRHPRIAVVLGHAGLHDTWREAIAAVRETPNLYVCLCGVPPYAGRQIVAHCPLERILFGSDAGLSPRAEQGYALARVREFAGWGLSPGQKQAILRDNPRPSLGGLVISPTIQSVQTARVRLSADVQLTVRGARGVHAESDFLLVRVLAATPHGRVGEGFGEVSATPVWSGEDGASAEHFVQTVLAPLLVGAPLVPVTALEQAMDAVLAGNVFTKAGVATALWDCWARVLDVPLAVALGGLLRTEVPIKMSISGDGSELARSFAAVRARGVGAYKVKVGLDPVADLERVRAARELAGANALLGVDANGGWSRSEAARIIAALREQEIAFVEQPCAPDDLSGLHAARDHGVPIIADESVFTTGDLVRLIRADAADLVSVYVGKAGGPGRAVEQGRVASAFGLGCVVGSNGEFGIGAAAQLQVACALPGLSEAVPSDIIGALYYTEDILATPLDSDGRRVRLGDGPGLGVRPREDIMARFR